MSLQNQYTTSIHPRSLAELHPERFDEFMSFFKRDCVVFRQSCSDTQDLAKRVQQIKSELSARKLFSTFMERVGFHSRLTNYRIISLEDYIRQLYDDYNSRNTQVFAMLRKAIGKDISLPPLPEEWDSLTEGERRIVEEALRNLNSNYIRFIVGICGLIDLTFFAFESECKVSCSLGCLEFSILFARGDIIQHGDIWRTLKMLGNVNPVSRVRCEICLMRNDCMHFSVNYEALANVYCYAIKVRMLSDYEELFFNTQMWEKIKVYFDELKSVVTCQIDVKNSCLEIKT